jgi:hypothetical protein
MYEPYTQDLAREHYRELLQERQRTNGQKSRTERVESRISLLTQAFVRMIVQLIHNSMVRRTTQL